eukprot:9956546-Prorocentrum_lima.AAC.1
MQAARGPKGPHPHPSCPLAPLEAGFGPQRPGQKLPTRLRGRLRPPPSAAWQLHAPPQRRGWQ